MGLNSFGMPNDDYEQSLAALRKNATRLCIPVVVNCAGFKTSDFVEGARLFGNTDGLVAGIVLNGGCPNTHQSPVSYDLNATREILQRVSEANPKVPVWWKISPPITLQQLRILQNRYPDVDLALAPTVDDEFLFRLAEMIQETGYIKALVACNTLGNSIRINQKGEYVTTPNNGRAGLSGPIMRTVVLDIIRELKRLLPESVDIIASGGNVTGDNVCEAFAAGAKCVQFASAPFWHGNPPRFFAEMLEESEALQKYLFTPSL